MRLRGNPAWADDGCDDEELDDFPSGPSWWAQEIRWRSCDLQDGIYSKRVAIADSARWAKRAGIEVDRREQQRLERATVVEVMRWMCELADRVEATEEGSMQRNLRRRRSSRTPRVHPNGARALGSRASMDTRFGADLSDDALDGLDGNKGSAVDAAMGRYETFHAKRPIRVTELVHDLPTSWVCVGDALAVMYRTDKWKADGTDEDYKHLHDVGDDKPYAIGKGVRFYEPAGRGQRGTRLPRPEAITLLGYCLGAFVRKDEDGHEYETNPRGCYLFSAPDGHTLYIYSPESQPDGSAGFLAAMNGGRLRVLKDGIDG